MKVKVEEVLLEKGISFNHIYLQKTIGDVKKIEEQYKKQIRRMEK